VATSGHFSDHVASKQSVMRIGHPFHFTCDIYLATMSDEA
jgi:hypothetical protein